MPIPVLPPIGNDLTQWGRLLTQYLRINLAKLGFKTADDNPSEDGIILWDRENKYAVVSLDQDFRQLATKQDTPSANIGSTGDVSGMIAWDNNYIYVCTGDYDGSTAIWKRVALASW